MSCLPNHFFSSGYVQNENALYFAAQKIAGFEDIIRGGRVHQLLPGLLRGSLGLVFVFSRVCLVGRPAMLSLEPRLLQLCLPYHLT